MDLPSTNKYRQHRKLEQSKINADKKLDDVTRRHGKHVKSLKAIEEEIAVKIDLDTKRANFDELEQQVNAQRAVVTEAEKDRDKKKNDFTEASNAANENDMALEKSQEKKRTEYGGLRQNAKSSYDKKSEESTFAQAYNKDLADARDENKSLSEKLDKAEQSWKKASEAKSGTATDALDKHSKKLADDIRELNKNAHTFDEESKKRVEKLTSDLIAPIKERLEILKEKGAAIDTRGEVSQILAKATNSEFLGLIIQLLIILQKKQLDIPAVERQLREIKEASGMIDKQTDDLKDTMKPGIQAQAGTLGQVDQSAASKIPGQDGDVDINNPDSTRHVTVKQAKP